MPIYDFKCEKCERTIEMLLTQDEAEVEKELVCEKCGSKMKRLFGAPAIHVHGYSYKNHYGLKKDSKK